MRTKHRRAAALAAISVLTTGLTLTAPAGAAAGTGGGAAAPEADRDRQGGWAATCRTSVEGSRVIAHCHNPYPRTDRVQLHVECERWWDIDADSEPVDLGPTAYAELSERCWKEVRAVWISHQAVPDSAGR
ncbi:hypothetical protein [Streptomyces sp. NPDC047928]|uniref:hypothetical protein n=1 Tax=unclassified Streptomyces TaxID=2593676 RepID=UPI00371CFBF6